MRFYFLMFFALISCVLRAQDIKISAMPTASNLTGAYIPIIQGGQNKKAPASLFVGSLPPASPTVAGVLKLYTTTGSNTDGTMDQNSITSALIATSPPSNNGISKISGTYEWGATNLIHDTDVSGAYAVSFGQSTSLTNFDVYVASGGHSTIRGGTGTSSFITVSSTGIQATNNNTSGIIDLTNNGTGLTQLNATGGELRLQGLNGSLQFFTDNHVYFKQLGTKTGIEYIVPGIGGGDPSVYVTTKGALTPRDYVKQQVDSVRALGLSNPMTTLGDIIYENSTPAATRLAGNTTTTKKFLTQTGTGSVSAAPGWNILVSGDIPNNAANTTGTASNLSGTPALPNGTTATTQSANDNSTKLSTTAYVDAAIAGFVSTPFADNIDLFKNSSDATKKLRFSLGGFTTGTTRTATWPDANITVARSDAAQTFTGIQTFSSVPVFSSGLGTPPSLTLTNATGLPVSTGISGLGTGVATWLATPSSANLASALTDETGTGAAVFAGSPAFTGTPTLGTLGYSDTGILMSFQSSTNSYNQVIVQNTNSGATASASFIVSNNSGTATTNYGELTINSSGYTGSGSFNLPGAVQLDAASGDLVVGTLGNNTFRVVTNNSTTDRFSIDGNGVFTFNAPTQGNLFKASANIDFWQMQNSSGTVLGLENSSDAVKTLCTGSGTGSSTTITVTSTTGFASSGLAMLDNFEIFSYTGITSNSLTGCTRGLYGTTAISWNSSDAVANIPLFRGTSSTNISYFIYKSLSNNKTVTNFQNAWWRGDSYVSDGSLFVTKLNGGTGNIYFSSSSLSGSSAVASIGGGSNQINIGGINSLAITQYNVANASDLRLFSVTDAAFSTARTASTELTMMDINIASVQQLSTGALTLQRFTRWRQPGLKFVGASALTDMANFTIDGAAIAGDNNTTTNTHALLIRAASSTVTGTGVVTNSFGATINAQTGATNNYAAQFLGGATFFAAGTTTYGSINIPSGTLMTTPTAGYIENNGTNLFFTPSSTRLALNVNATAATSATTGTMTTTMTNLSVLTITPTGDCTFNASGGITGQSLSFVITTSGTTSWNLTFNTNYKSTGVLATGTTSGKIFTVTFTYDGTNWNEVARTVAM